MIKSFAKLLALGLATVMVCGLGITFMRWFGTQQSFQSPPHPWFERDFWWIYSPSLAELCRTEGFDAPPQQPHWIIRVPIQRHDEKWHVPCPTPILIGDFLKASTHPDWMIDIQSRDTWSLDQLIQALTPLDKSKRLAITASSQKVSVFLRKKAPQWLYAADSASLVRLRLFESLWLESTMEFWPDFIISSMQTQDPFYLDARAAEELQRRKKRILWNWNENASGDPLIPIQGIMTTRPTEAQHKFGTRL